jgi:hypothetical protein
MMCDVPSTDIFVQNLLNVVLVLFPDITIIIAIGSLFYYAFSETRLYSIDESMVRG